MSPGNTAQLLSALASPARKREFLRTTENGRPREPPSVALGELLKLPAHAIKRRRLQSRRGDVSRRCCTNGTHTLMGGANRYVALFRIECDGPQSACGSARCRAYPPPWSCGRVAEGGGLLNRYRLVKAYRGFESLRLRHPLVKSALPKWCRGLADRCATGLRGWLRTLRTKRKSLTALAVS
jgi:hypothetical protein